MLTDSELMILMQDQEVLSNAMNLKRDFLRHEPDFLDMSDDDFVSLVLLTPSVGVALANKSISLFEELILQHKARKLSRGSYFWKKDPIVKALDYLIANFDLWEDKFYDFLRVLIFSSLRKNQVVLASVSDPNSLTGDFNVDILNAPFILVKSLSFIFLSEDDDLMNDKVISRVEFEKVKHIGEKLGMGQLPIFKSFCDSFTVKEGR